MTSALTSAAASLGELVGGELVSGEDAVSQAERLAAGVVDGAALGQLVAGTGALEVRKGATVRKRSARENLRLGDCSNVLLACYPRFSCIIYTMSLSLAVQKLPKFRSSMR